MSIQIVSSRIKRPSDRQCIGIGWLTSSKFQLGCLLSRLIGCLSCLKEQNELVSCWFSLNSDFTMTIFLFLQEKNTTQKFTVYQDFVNLHNFFLPISTCCCWTWICWWPIWAATKYCWLYDIFFDSRGNFSKKFQNPNAEKSQAKRLKTQECCSE